MSQGLGSAGALPDTARIGSPATMPAGGRTAESWLRGLERRRPVWRRLLRDGAAARTARDVPARGLSAAARQMFERQYATIEITDSVAMMGGHQVGALRGYQDQLQGAVRGTRVGRVERLAALPRDDGHSRQDRRRRVARPPAGHGDQPAALACARAAAGAGQAPARHRGRRR